MNLQIGTSDSHSFRNDLIVTQNSYAEKYCKDHNLKYCYVDAENTSNQNSSLILGLLQLLLKET